MDSQGYREYRECADRKLKRNAIMIKGDFSDFDRIFYQRDDRNKMNSLLLISTKKQMFKRLDLENHQISELGIKVGQEYQQVEYYDEKLFCMNREPLTMDIFFSSKKQQLFHKRSICFANKELKLKEEFSLTIWKHQEAGTIYRCLLGPLEDGRYMNFDLKERYFDSKENAEIMIERVFFVRLELNDQSSGSGAVVCAMNEAKKSIICFNKDTKKFFEYNDFSGGKSKPIYVDYDEKVVRNADALRKMYLYYSYDFFPKKEQNRLQTLVRDIREKTDCEIFVRNMYTEVLLCMDCCPLIKLSLLETAAMAGQEMAWSIMNVDMNGSYPPIDIAINGYTGEIYCLCRQGIRILENSGRTLKNVDAYERERRRRLVDRDYDS